MAWSAPSARALLAASPIALVEPPAIGERITEWLKITAVPLLVFLIGACIWGCIKNTATWRVLTEDGGGSTHNQALGEVRSDSPRAISNNEAAKDLEAGLELSQVRCRDEESDSSLKSTACFIAANPAMDGNARPNSDIGDAIPYHCVSTLCFSSICFTVGGVAAGSLGVFFELWFVFCEHAACITVFGIFLAMVATVFISIVVNL